MIVVHRGDAVAPGQRLRASLGLARDRAKLHGNAVHLPVGAQMKGRGKASPDDSDSHRRVDDVSPRTAKAQASEWRHYYSRDETRVKPIIVVVRGC